MHAAEILLSYATFSGSYLLLGELRSTQTALCGSKRGARGLRQKPESETASFPGVPSPGVAQYRGCWWPREVRVEET